MTKLWDVAVVGAGTAGLPAALSAAARGAKVVLVEAADVIGGTLHLSSGSLSAAGGRVQATKGIADSPQQHLDDCIRIAHGSGDERKLRLWIDNAAESLEWLLDSGLAFGDNQPGMNNAHEPYDAARIYTPPKGGVSYIEALSPLLDTAVADGGITLMLNTRMKAVTTDSSGAATGLVAAGPDGADIQIAAKNVVLTTGGYAANADYWMEQHGRPKRVHAWPHSQGDGLTVARALGAQVRRADAFLPTVGGTVDIDAPDTYWIHTLNSAVFRKPWEIFVNLNGERFMSEDRTDPDMRERLLLAQPDAAFWVVFDGKARRDSPNFFRWDEEKVRRAFDTHNDFQRADTIEALAEACGLDPKALATTVARYNAGQRVNSDVFDRTHMPAPIAEAPFYAVKHYGISVLAFGGIDTDERLRVLDAEGKPIPNLFAAGEILGAGLFGNGYLGGSMVGSAVTYGRRLGDSILSW